VISSSVCGLDALLIYYSYFEAPLVYFRVKYLEAPLVEAAVHPTDGCHSPTEGTSAFGGHSFGAFSIESIAHATAEKPQTRETV